MTLPFGEKGDELAHAHLVGDFATKGRGHGVMFPHFYPIVLTSKAV